MSTTDTHTDTLEDQLRDVYKHEDIRKLMDRDDRVAALLDVLIDTFAAYASMGDDEVALIGNLGNILADAIDEWEEA